MLPVSALFSRPLLGVVSLGLLMCVKLKPSSVSSVGWATRRRLYTVVMCEFENALLVHTLQAREGSGGRHTQ